MDLTQTIIPKSDQLNADDLMAGAVTVTIREVSKGSAEQPVDVHLVEYPGRAYRPSKSMRRVMVMGWGAEAANYVGRKLTLFRNPDIKFGAEKVGGIEIAAMSHIDKPLTVALTATRGKRKNFTVALLAADISPADTETWVTRINASDTLEALQQVWSDATTAGVTRHKTVVDAKDERKKALTA